MKQIKPKFDVISIGDATLDTFIELEEATLTCSLHKDKCQLCLNYADKIPISSSIRKVAGNAANVAVGTSRLGLKSSFWSVLGDDDFAKEVMKKMREEKVNTNYVTIEKGKESNYAVVLNYQGERTQLIYRGNLVYRFPKNLAVTRLLYITAMGKNNEHLYEDLITYVFDNRIPLAYNPGKEQIRNKRKISTTILKYTEILLVNKDEATLLLEGREPYFLKGTKKMPRPEIKDILLALHELGPKVIVVTDGVNGSYAFAEHIYYSLPIFPGPLVERTGAGDAYSTGFLSALLHGKEVPEAMAWGTFNSWSVVQKVGPIDGLLSVAKIKQMIRKHPGFRGKKI